MVEINSTEFGYITIDGKTYGHDVIVSYTGRVRKGWLQTRHVIAEEDFLDLLKEKPDAIVIGTGQDGCVEISPTVSKLIKETNVEFVTLATPQAIKKFNELIRLGRKVVAYMHVTC
jgi:hypothetical protein